MSWRRPADPALGAASSGHPQHIPVRRVTALVVRGDPASVDRVTREAFPVAEVSVVSANELLRARSRVRALGRLRRQHPEAHVVFGSDIVGRPQRPLHLLVAWLAGADQLCLLEPDGRSDCRRVVSGLPRALARITLERVAGTALLVVVNSALRLLSHLDPQRRTRRVLWNGRDCLRIVYLRSETDPGSNIGGTTSHAVGIVRALADLGHHVEVLSSPPPPPFEHKTVKTVLISHERTLFRMYPFRDIEIHMRFLARAWWLVRCDPPDCYVSRHRRFDAVGAVLSLVTQRPLVLQHEGAERLVAEYYDPESAMRTLDSFERLNHQVASAILAVSTQVARDLEHNRGVAPQKLTVSQSGVDTARFRPGAGGTERRRQLGIADDAVVVGFCGTFGPWHGAELLVDAISALPNRRVHCLLVGDGAARASIQQQVGNSQRNRFTFVGLVPLMEMPAYLDACDILACPTRLVPGQAEFFGSPTKLFEYMAAGKAIIASAVGQIPDVIRAGDTGLLHREGDTDGLARGIGELVGDADLRAALGRAARAEAVSHGGWEHNARAALAVLASRDAPPVRAESAEIGVTVRG